MPYLEASLIEDLMVYTGDWIIKFYFFRRKSDNERLRFEIIEQLISCLYAFVIFWDWWKLNLLCVSTNEELEVWSMFSVFQ